MTATIDVRSLENTDLLIAGKARPTAERIPVLDPATGRSIAHIASASEADVDDAVEAAHAAQPGWAKLHPRERGMVLFEIGRLIRQHGDELARLESIDVGKPLSQAKTDVEVAAQYFEFYGGFADKLYGDTIPLDDTNLAMTIREPMGVSAIIVPWNYPLQIGCRGLAPCLMAGNGVVLKPASEAPLTALAMGNIALSAGLPAGLFNIVTGPGPEVGGYLARHEGINQISFTGSVATGSAVMHAAADHVVPVLLELGGKSPSVVFPDADLDLAIPVLTKACIQNAGQTCSAHTRAIVVAEAYDRFVERVGEQFDAVELGRGLDDPAMGPLISERQQRVVSDYVQIGREEGGTIIAGGEPAEVPGLEGGFFYRPTLVADVAADARVATEEIFGPVLSVIRAADESEAIAIADSTDFGLVSSVWTSDVNKALRVAREIKHGQVYINSYGAAGGVPLPFGGYKKSGFGREKGVEGVYAYQQVKTVIFTVPPAG
jgi:acyl-CoA reductase-like NAD-dependent aldehyde dehydrogenase